MIQLHLFADATKARTALDQAFVDLRLDIFQYIAGSDAGCRTVVSSAGLDLLEIVRDGAVDFPKKELPHTLVQELRRHKLATFAYEGKRVRVRLNEQRIVEMGERAAERTLRWCS